MTALHCEKALMDLEAHVLPAGRGCVIMQRAASQETLMCSALQDPTAQLEERTVLPIVSITAPFA